VSFEVLDNVLNYGFIILGAFGIVFGIITGSIPMVLSSVFLTLSGVAGKLEWHEAFPITFLVIAIVTNLAFL